jgi:hypothetical protein
VVIFEGVLILRFLVKLFAWNFANIWKKQNYKFYDFSFILSHLNKGMQHSEVFDKKIFKREYLGRIIDNVSYYPILFSSTVMCRF